ncbi:hypothetical protein SEA_POKYPUPPY_104 [Gordonia phage PokyPuppy]|nr:hypothetical protein SEA_POKYPUPPY_104 [Gordonia phage PokyPuppy]
MFDTKPRTTPITQCAGYANDCECPCTRPTVGQLIRPRDIESGMTIQAVSNYRASSGEYATVAPDTYEVDEVTYEFWTASNGVDVVTWHVVAGNVTLLLNDTDDHIYIVIADN